MVEQIVQTGFQASTWPARVKLQSYRIDVSYIPYLECSKAVLSCAGDETGVCIPRYCPCCNSSSKLPI